VTVLRPAVPGGVESGEFLDSQPEWVPTRALGRAVLLTGLLLIAGVLAGRVDLVVLAIPFALGTAVALHRRPRERPRIALDVDDGYLVEGTRRPPRTTWWWSAPGSRRGCGSRTGTGRSC
jgi:hypothetical protein